MPMGLTERQKTALDFIARRLHETAIAPTLRELAQHLGCRSNFTPKWIVDVLVERGHLRRLPGRSRALELTQPTMSPGRPPDGGVRYFRFDDEAKELAPWPEKPWGGAVSAAAAPEVHKPLERKADQ